eukprot:TRINITY_DN1144_c0_g1_i2.p1 TRINITY_DN1144_c0_g1~~TRINITY_DN1144_c0_g1_i2.p1  ORF type:complete len:168 (-),score=41.15 TRINITY_DN1144_c0_g1_i2:484-987(-)
MESHERNNFQWQNAETGVRIFWIGYLGGLIALVGFLLADLNSDKSLTPSVMKSWLVLLTVMLCVTFFVGKSYLIAMDVDAALDEAVTAFGGLEGKMLEDNDGKLNLDLYRHVLGHWRVHVSDFKMKVFGVIGLENLSETLAWYSFPFVVAFVSPVVKVVETLIRVHQ